VKVADPSVTLKRTKPEVLALLKAAETGASVIEDAEPGTPV
jgi:hypothetical protein